MFYFYRHSCLCATSVFGGNSSNCVSRCHGNGNLNLYNWWNLDWTNYWSQVNDSEHIQQQHINILIEFSHSLCSQDIRFIGIVYM